MTDSNVGVVVSTLVADPRNCTGAELRAAADAAAEVGIEQFMMWPHHISSPGLSDSDERIAAWTGRVRVLEGATGFTRGATPRFAEEVAGTGRARRSARCSDDRDLHAAGADRGHGCGGRGPCRARRGSRPCRR